MINPELALASSEGFFTSIGKDIISPVDTEAWGPFSNGLLITGLLLLGEEVIVDPAQEDTVEDKPLGSSAKYGDQMGKTIPNGAYILGALAVGYWGDSAIAYRRAKHMFAATAYSGAMAQILKNIVREPRPNDRHDRASFPSGHTTTAFTFAAVVGADHGFIWGVPAYMVATFVGYSRMNDNKHYLHDITAGATLGIGYGLGIYYRMGEKAETPGSFTGLRFENMYLGPNDEEGRSLWAQWSY